MHAKQSHLILLLLLLVLAACGPSTGATPTGQASSLLATGTPAGQASSPLATGTPAAGAGQILTVMTHDSFDVSDEVVAAFKAQCQCEVRFLKSGDAGLMLNQAILSKGHPQADVIYGVDNTFLSRALDNDILEPYQSPALADVAGEFKLDPTFREAPVDYGDVCLNYDKAWFTAKNLPPPADLPDLARPEYKGLTVVENPATSSPGLAFLLATIGRFGEGGSYSYLNYWADLKANDVLIAQGWEDAYNGSFTVSGGDRPIVVSYASSPPAAVYYAEKPLDESPIGAVTADGSCFRQVEFVGILKGTAQRALAEQWIDFMLSKTFQEDVPLKMFVFPVNRSAALPDVFVRFAQVPAHPITMDPATIEAKREQWIEAWTRTMRR
jgi:thiamine transport system substrate-binding protein